MSPIADLPTLKKNKLEKKVHQQCTETHQDAMTGREVRMIFQSNLGGILTMFRFDKS